MVRQTIRINQGRVLMWQFRLAGSLLVIFIIGLAMQYLPEFAAIVSMLVISPLIPLIWTSHYLLIIDPKEKTYTEAIWILGKEKGTTVPYTEIEKIFINSVRTTQQITSYGGNVHTTRSKEYQAYLLFDDGKKLFLCSGDSTDLLYTKLDGLPAKLNVQVTENF